MMTNVTRAFSGFLGFMLFSLAFLIGAPEASAQSVEEAMLTLEAEKENIRTYFEDKFPDYPTVKPSSFSNVDWDQVNHLYAVNRLLGLLRDADVKPLTDEVEVASQMPYPNAATVDGMYFLDRKHPKSTDNPVVLKSYFNQLLDL